MNNQKIAKIMAFLALVGIIISIIGTGLLFLLDGNNSHRTMTKDELIKYYSSIGSGAEIKFLTGNLENSGTGVSTGNTN